MPLRLFLLPPPPGAPPVPGRDLRIDFVRGLALFFIFLNHIPDNAASWVSNRNWGFSDATEIFVFVSGYSATLAYVGGLATVGFAVTAARILRRVWQIYLAHIVLFMFFVAQIAYVSATFDNPMFAEEMLVGPFLERPDIMLVQAVTLRFNPANMDVLPLYIALLAVFPAILVAVRRWGRTTLAASIALYLAAPPLGLNLPSYPSGGWFFNPFAWQLLFVLGAYCAVHRHDGFWRRLRPTLLVPAIVLYLLFSFAVVLTWHVPEWSAWLPGWLAAAIYPIDKTNLDILRALHFLGCAYLFILFVPLDARWLKHAVVQPIILCGRQSLHVFCVGVFLSFAGHFAIYEIGGGNLVEILVSAAGILLMIAVAALVDWYREAARSGSGVPRLRGAAAE